MDLTLMYGRSSGLKNSFKCSVVVPCGTFSTRKVHGRAVSKLCVLDSVCKIARSSIEELSVGRLRLLSASLVLSLTCIIAKLASRNNLGKNSLDIDPAPEVADFPLSGYPSSRIFGQLPLRL